MGKTWKVEEKFKKWGRPLKKTGDEFTDWALQVKKDHDEAALEEELKRLFYEDLYGKE